MTKGFCLACGVEADVLDGRLGGIVVVVCMEGCGARTTRYRDGKVAVWGMDGKTVVVPEGCLMVSPGGEA